MRRIFGYAGAFVMLGWYLLLPPLQVEGPVSDPHTAVEADTTAPLSQWKIIATLGTEKECRKYSEHALKVLREQKTGNEGGDQGAGVMAKYWFDKSLCVATGDPRLKEK